MPAGQAYDPWLDAPPRRRWPWPLLVPLIGCGGVLLLAVAAGVIFLLSVGTANTPGLTAEAEDEIDKKVLAEMRADGLIEADERVLFLYSAALFHVRDDASFFTDRRVVRLGADEHPHREARYEEIDSIELVRAEDELENSIVRIGLRDHSVFELEVDPGEHGDTRFERLLRQTWMEHRDAPGPEAGPR
jgi:hypothetical protein